MARIKSKVPGTREHRALKGTGGVKKHIPGGLFLHAEVLYLTSELNMPPAVYAGVVPPAVYAEVVPQVLLQSCLARCSAPASGFPGVWHATADVQYVGLPTTKQSLLFVCQAGTAEHNVTHPTAGAGVGPTTGTTTGNVGTKVASAIPGTTEHKATHPRPRGRGGIVAKIKKAIPGYERPCQLCVL